MVTLDALPVLEPPSPLSNEVCANNLSNKLTEEEFAAVICHMRC